MSNTVILGTGIIGLSTAYYLSLSQDPSTIQLVDPSPTLFSSASGYAAGFLSRDWFCDESSDLGLLSFEEHKKLAEENSGAEKWGYSVSRSLNFVSHVAAEKAKKSGKKGVRGDDWLRVGGSRAETASGNDGVGVKEAASTAGEWPKWFKKNEGDEMESISKEGSTAQVDPLKLCQFLLASCLERGVQLHHPAKALSVHQDMRSEISSIRILNTSTNIESDIPCTKILIAAGCWSPEVFSTLFPESTLKLPITSLAGHSLVVRTPNWNEELEEKECQAVFASDEEGYCPEVFSRKGGEIYVAGLNSSTEPLPKLATESKFQEDAIQRLENTARRIFGFDESSEMEIVRKGLCFRPVTKRGTPILAKVADDNLGGMSTRNDRDGGVWLAAGHGPWGISMSLGTGKVMAEMIQGKPTSADVSKLGF
ncbi:uncharacterized protein EAE98_004808 [Botrytis deweyae]|uniref:FAD dependent oxidoreductase domain-containing protein n=1 Tax=Botrytis deweyae TaxID=2478750 RepID=A0ABQ7IPF6_9HELO|nr:uncharacterized protein EAE98_004808 [Botrytis deweyae]KAF7930408.1 hypothetical protein EAE98_004808 [Botrytis deweyae]